MNDGGCSCRGAPRDLGLDQGRAWRDAVREAVASLPARTRLEARLPFASGGRVAGTARDLGRYFPHMAERVSGLARGAGVERRELCALLARERRDAPESEASASAGVLVAVAPERTGGAPLLARTVEWREARVRTSGPESDYASEELTLPWLVPPLLGVNEHGLAVAGASLPPEPGALQACAAPAVLLVQDCLQRFDTVQKAIEWCQVRPAGGCASLLLADRTGDVAEVAIAGAERRIRRASEGILVGHRAGARGEAIAKALREYALLDAARLTRVLAEHPGPRSYGGRAVADPEKASLLVA